MSNALASRLAMLEAKNRSHGGAWSKSCREAEVRQLLRTKGLDPDADDLLVIHRCIVAPDGEESIPNRIASGA